MGRAVLSSCGRYRYQLERQLLVGGPTVLFLGVNPSTADASINDHTVTKWMGFGLRWGAGRILVGNVFAYRSTDVTRLAHVEDPVGPENMRHVAAMAREAAFVVPCWGSSNKLPRDLRPDLADMLQHLRDWRCPLFHLGLTASGDPKHPLMLGYDTPLTHWA